MYIYNTSTSIYRFCKAALCYLLLDIPSFCDALEIAQNSPWTQTYPKWSVVFPRAARTFHQPVDPIYPTIHTAVLKKRDGCLWDTKRQSSSSSNYTRTQTQTQSPLDSTRLVHKTVLAHTKHTHTLDSSARLRFARSFGFCWKSSFLFHSVDLWTVCLFCVWPLWPFRMCVFKTVLFLDSKRRRRLLQGLGCGNPVGSLARISIGLCMCKYM